MKKKIKSKRNKTSSLSLPNIFPEFQTKAYCSSRKEAHTEYLNNLRNSYTNKGLVIFLGAGVSKSIGLPDWRETLRFLSINMMSQKVQRAARRTEPSKPEPYYDLIISTRKQIEKVASLDKPLLMLARTIKNEYGDDLPYMIARTFYRRIYNLNRREIHMSRAGREYSIPSYLPSSSLVDALVSLCRPEKDVQGIQAIINYNFDDLVETILQKEKIKCLTIKSPHDAIPSGTLPSFHVHGILPHSIFLKRGQYKKKDLGNFVFSEDEYHEEYSNPYRWSNMTQMNWMSRHTGLFIGLSMEDPNLRRLIDVTHRQYPDLKNYAIVVRKSPVNKNNSSKLAILRNLFEQVETTAYERIGINVIWVDRYEDVPVVLKKICS
jgi:hypothetical protein